MIPYGRQCIDDEDIQAVVDVLRSDWLTTGPAVEKFEGAIAEYVGAKHAVAVSSGTAALHAAMFALDVGPGDEVIVPTLTFAATANCILYQGGTPVFADVDPDSLLIDPADVEKKITARTKAIIGVDYAGHPCDWDALGKIAEERNLILVDDGCHALGAEYKHRKIGNVAALTAFSFHPVKHITTGEGGAITTNAPQLAERMRQFRNHGISTDFRQREAADSWYYEMRSLGYNYRISDIQCALGASQLGKLTGMLERRREISQLYEELFSGVDAIIPLKVAETVKHAYHLYAILLSEKVDRKNVFNRMRQAGIGVNVHYIPTHLHPYYREHFGTGKGLCPIAESRYERLLSLPMWAGLGNSEVRIVAENLFDAINT